MSEIADAVTEASTAPDAPTAEVPPAPELLAEATPPAVKVEAPSIIEALDAKDAALEAVAAQRDRYKAALLRIADGEHGASVAIEALKQ